jgi:hypothetical protein
MSNIGSWWLASHEAEEGETVLGSCFAAHCQSADRSVGFCPNLYEYATGGQRWSVPFSLVRDIIEQPQSITQSWLRVDLKDERTELFIVYKRGAERLGAAIRDQVGAPR